MVAEHLVIVAHFVLQGDPGTDDLVIFLLVWRLKRTFRLYVVQPYYTYTHLVLLVRKLNPFI